MDRIWAETFGGSALWHSRPVWHTGKAHQHIIVLAPFPWLSAIRGLVLKTCCHSVLNLAKRSLGGLSLFMCWRAYGGIYGFICLSVSSDIFFGMSLSPGPLLHWWMVEGFISRQTRVTSLAFFGKVQSPVSCSSALWQMAAGSSSWQIMMASLALFQPVVNLPSPAPPHGGRQQHASVFVMKLYCRWTSFSPALVNSPSWTVFPLLSCFGTNVMRPNGSLAIRKESENQQTGNK